MVINGWWWWWWWWEINGYVVFIRISWNSEVSVGNCLVLSFRLLWRPHSLLSQVCQLSTEVYTCLSVSYFKMAVSGNQPLSRSCCAVFYTSTTHNARFVWFTRSFWHVWGWIKNVFASQIRGGSPKKWHADNHLLGKVLTQLVKAVADICDF